MKKFFEEYGKFSIAAIVIILLLLMIKPIGAAIREGVNSTTDEFTEKANNIIFSMNTPSSRESTDVSKGDLITIDSKQYRVLSINNNEAKLLAMYDATRMKFNNSSFTTSFDGTDGQKYEGSKIDNYLENEFYPSLSPEIQNAIVPQNITQNMYRWNGTPADASSWFKFQFTSTDTSGTNYTVRKTGSVSVGSRHVYALDIEDVISYLGSSFTPQQLNTMFWNVDHYIESTPNCVIWLRSASANDSTSVWDVYSSVGHFDYDIIDDVLCDVRPTFIIDLSKLNYTK